MYRETRETYSISKWAAFILATLLSLPIFADSQRIIDYQYDGAGNIIGIRSGRNLGPPDVTQLNPAFVNQGSSIFVEATGVNLFRADVTTAATGISVSNVFSTETKITFILSANDTAAFGLAPLTFTTRLGSDTENITVAERTPVISTEPNPIVLAPDAPPVLVKLVFDQPFITDQTYDLAIRDTTVASVSETFITLPAGSTEVSVTVSALTVGTTALEINQLADFIALAIPVIVNDDQLPAGAHIINSQMIGVTTYLEQSINISGTYSTPFPVGVATSLEPSFTGTGIFSTPFPIGVAASLEPSFTGTGIFVTQPTIGTAYGTVVSQLSPETVSLGASLTLVLDGFDLGVVTGVTFNPDGGITQPSPFTVNIDGTQMQIFINVDPSASTAGRTIFLSTPSGEVLVPTVLNIE